MQFAIRKNTYVSTISKKYTNIKPWVTPGLVRCIRHRDRLHKQLKSQPHNKLLSITYKRYRNFCNNLLKKIKIEYEKVELQKAGKSSKLVWRYIKNNALHTNYPEPPFDLINTAISPTEALNEVNNFFVKIGKNLAENTIGISSQNLTEQLSPSTAFSFVLLSTDIDEVTSILTGLRDACAVGWDNITNHILKTFKKSLAPPLTHIYQLCLEQGVFPTLLKKAVVIPIHKSGDKKCISNYRPISLLSGLSKVLEKLINIRLVKYLECNKLLSNNQFGFRPKRSTNQAVHELTNHLSNNLDKGIHSIGIFLDLAKAFDTISCSILLQKLETYGIRGNQLTLFSDYLSDRKQYVKIGQHTSAELQNTRYGLPQGSILGPTLFLIYINDLCNLNIPNCKIISYADDTVLLFTATSSDLVYKYAQNGFNIVNKWLNNNLLHLNISKTKYILFAMRNTNIALTNPHIYVHSCTQYADSACNCPTLAISHDIKYLGITIDTNLNFRKHIDLLCTRVRKLIYAFKHLRNIADYTLIRQVYLALCQSTLTYCITSWGGAAKTILLPLERAQRSILKVATLRPYTFPTHELYTSCNVLTVRQLFILLY